MQSLPVNSLVYEGIKNNLKNFIKNVRDENGVLVYQDYNLESSGIGTLIGLLSYHTHYLGYYIKMMLNESFLDTAARRDTLLSKAKMTGYIPKREKICFC